jgi:2'-hydroxyisoflavone reductase
VRLLILGGTVFLGRHVVAAALERGHDVTILSRGLSGHPPPPGVEWVRGDRDGGLDALGRRSWDAIVDTSGYVPRVVAQSAALDAGHYTFVSSGNVYADPSRPGLTEDAPVEALPPDHGEDVADHYGALKAACERELPAGALVVRSGLIAGAHDPTHRFTYWAERVAAGGAVLAPEPRTQPVQLIDARDTAEWIVRSAEDRLGGTFNVTGEPTTLEDLLRALPGDGELTWVDEEWLLDQGVEPWADLPLWLAPSANPELAGFLSVDVSKALAAGLTLRPLAETARAALDHPEPPQTSYGLGVPPAGIAREREADLLARWGGQPVSA